jgi:hypothetical protein
MLSFIIIDAVFFGKKYTSYPLNESDCYVKFKIMHWGQVKTTHLLEPSMVT